ncbi:unnamed protein product [Rotaria sp. Silwood2]|nr:unnamed protein product [Rotaria sp. Silwood2]CAF3148477.1 unnamed protein product [Rotaria sp. Silwood2]CAF3330641.1 unnamed protein product [Rotaria sp. Silwood2]CAF3444601.1 unnamed protein product [Rotaria sp. Silwood2]CAF4482997.1 unnamed protein product [Rotaria sp. Silwood2]
MSRPAGNPSVERNPECISASFLERNDTNGLMRLCCQGLPSTTLPPHFPKECGKQLYAPLEQRIIGGSVVNHILSSLIDIFQPWHVLVHGTAHSCSGTLIDERHVLTAAHCIIANQNFTVTVGIHDVTAPHFIEQKIRVEKIYVHEEYDSVKASNDIDILYLSKSVEVTDKVNFICLPGPEASIGEKVYVGKTRT